jgi:hypothetical protein
MTSYAIAAVVLMLVGAYRLYAERKDRKSLLMWALLIGATDAETVNRPPG